MDEKALLAVIEESDGRETLRSLDFIVSGQRIDVDSDLIGTLRGLESRGLIARVQLGDTREHSWRLTEAGCDRLTSVT